MSARKTVVFVVMLMVVFLIIRGEKARLENKIDDLSSKVRILEEGKRECNSTLDVYIQKESKDVSFNLSDDEANKVLNQLRKNEEERRKHMTYKVVKQHVKRTSKTAEQIAKEKAEEEAEEKERQRLWADFNRITAPSLRRATVEDYSAWMRGYVDKGGKPNIIFGSTFERERSLDDYRVATEDFYISPLYSIDKVTIIVPRGIKLLGGDRGHNKLLFMDSYVCIGYRDKNVVLYADIKF